MRGSNTDRVRWALEELLPYLHTYVNQTLQQAAPNRQPVDQDITVLVGAVLDEWGVFRMGLGRARPYLHELREVRNALMHFQPFSDDQARRAIDTIRLIADAIGAPTTPYDGLASRTKVGGSASARLARPMATAARIDMPSHPSLSRRRSSQRDVMRAIWTHCAPDEERAVREYAAAERQGEAPRKQNNYGLSPEQYARALLSDGLKKGWLSN